MNKSDEFKVKRYRRAFPTTVLKDDEIITVLDSHKKAKQKIDNWFKTREQGE